MSATRVAIAGCTGRMGTTLLRLAGADPRFEIVAAVSEPGDARCGHDAGLVAGVAALGVAVGTTVPSACDVLIEFTSPAGCMAWTQWCADHRVALVSGTTGLSEAQHARLREAGQHIPLVWSPNMSTGVNLMLTVVEDLAGRLDEMWDVEICETHHRRKMDAPSGTAGALLDAVCRARGHSSVDAAIHGRQGACGPRRRGEIGVHALRMGAIVGEHEVHFTTDDESLTIRHRAFARDAFAAGALRAARWVAGRPAGLYGMRDVLFG